MTRWDNRMWRFRVPFPRAMPWAYLVLARWANRMRRFRVGLSKKRCVRVRSEFRGHSCLFVVLNTSIRLNAEVGFVGDL